MKGIEKVAGGWRLKGGKVLLDIDKSAGDMRCITISGDKKFVWTPAKGGVSICDDLTGKRYTGKDVKNVRFEKKGDILTIKRMFKDAPFILTEEYTVEDGDIRWNASLKIDKGSFRSCSIVYSIPWPQPAYGNALWVAKDGMPSELGRFGGFAFEYGEITSGILFPAVCVWRKQEKAGLLLAMPFDFKTPRFRFVSGYREPSLDIRFDWLALSESHPARASFIIRAAFGGWRPSLGYLYERFKEYFIPRSKTIHNLWGGHISGGYNLSQKDAETMAELGLKWYEVHGHFPFYGNYHPEGMKKWTSGHPRKQKNAPYITVDIIKRTIKRLHSIGASALPYIQVSGDGDDKLQESILKTSRIKDIYGEIVSAWPGTHLLNSDPSLPFGKDMVRQIKGMVARYPEMDGVFLDQACYNFLDTGHSDGITAFNNRPAYMTGFNYFPHLELLSKLLHPEKVIIANGPFAIGIMKYIDGFMAESQGWLCDHLQYYAIEKPMFFLEYRTNDRAVEEMFQKCLIYGAGFTSYPQVYKTSKHLYEIYVPVLQRLYRRRWVFEEEPIILPPGFNGNLFISERRTLIASIVSKMGRYKNRKLLPETIYINSKDIRKTRKVILYRPGEKPESIKFSMKDNTLQFDIPGNTIAGVAELL
ncbi:MAG: hypothetical protein NC905_05710 [Candidatus Omnitrophica bacterium]|nr:hypothetical protein [Candidatus Omnitrophota bacterium]